MAYNPKLSYLIIGVIVVGMLVVTYTTFMAKLNDEYSNTAYDAEEFAFLNKMNETQALSMEIKNASTEIAAPEGVTDILNGFFGGAYNALKLGAKSFTTVQDMTNEVGKQNHLDINPVYITGIGTILLVIIFVGIFISSITKREE